MCGERRPNCYHSVPCTGSRLTEPSAATEQEAGLDLEYASDRLVTFLIGVRDSCFVSPTF